MSGSLANRLAVAAWSEMKGPPYSNWSYDQLPAAAKDRVDATVVALLRELSREYYGHPFMAGAGDEMDALADEIAAGVVERGEQG